MLQQKQLGLKLRAILAPSNFRNAEDSRFEMLFLRFRENEERENLSAFERLLSIGEMYENVEFCRRWAESHGRFVCEKSWGS